MRVLVAEDDAHLRSILERGLAESAYAVDAVGDGRAALRMAAMNEYDAVVLDVMMPAPDGIEVCRALRARGSRVPVLMLTARDAVADRIAGLDAGADDYLSKPFDFGELLARLRALMRRAPELLPSEIRVADLVVDTRAQTVRRAGRGIRLTAKEYTLLEYLARNAGRVVSRADLCAHVWDDNHDPLSNAIEVNINRLRAKVDAGAPPLIHTRRGAGYLLGDPSSDA
ncbi:MAG TPA: response regulator transcription factor [Longimicrobiaceae bacterium]|jgi:two-component system copper resistance phosphate regulon response regulator CusR|nr:response regulator transcription factor [Longimicrobiaceae bacterium]